MELVVGRRGRIEKAAAPSSPDRVDTDRLLAPAVVLVVPAARRRHLVSVVAVMARPLVVDRVAGADAGEENRLGFMCGFERNTFCLLCF